MVPPPSWTALESSGLGRSASLSAGPRIQQVNEAAWPLPGWACANVSVAINRVIRMSRLLKLFRQTRYPSGAQGAHPTRLLRYSHSRRAGPVKHCALSAVSYRAHASGVGKRDQWEREISERGLPPRLLRYPHSEEWAH